MKDLFSEIPNIVKISRPKRWIVSGFIYVIGYLICYQKLDLNLFLGSLYFLLPFNLLVFGVNDYYDITADIANPRKSKQSHSTKAKHLDRILLDWIMILNIPFILYFFIISNIQAKLSLGLIIASVIAYNYKLLRFKAIPVLDTLVSSAKYLAIFLFALAISGSNNLFLPIALSILSWGCASHILNSIQDLVPDQKINIKTTAVYIGAKNSIIACLILFSVAATLPAIFYWPGGIIISLIMSVYILNISFFAKYKSDAQTRKYQRAWDNHLWLDIVTIFWISTYLLISTNFLKQIDSIFVLSIFYVCFFGLQFVLIAYNLFGLKKPKVDSRGEVDWPKISVLIHSYNQSEYIASTLLALLGQHYPDFEIIFTDLGSDDNTLSIVENYQDKRLEIVNIAAREKFWRINTWANQQLIKKARSDIVVLLSADTVLLPDSLTYIASIMKNGADVLSILPADQNRTFSQKFILSQKRYFLLGCFPAAYLSKRSNFALASNSLIAFNKSRTEIFDNFSPIKRSPLSNIDFCSQAKKHRLSAIFYLASDLATSHNNASLKDIFFHNYQNLYPALKFNMPATVFSIIAGFFSFCLPIIILIYQLIDFNVINISILCLAMIIALINHIIIAINGRQSIISTLFFPITSLISIILIFISMLNYELLKPRWQNRTELDTI